MVANSLIAGASSKGPIDIGPRFPLSARLALSLT